MKQISEDLRNYILKEFRKECSKKMFHSLDFCEISEVIERL